MRSQPGTSVWDSLAGILILLPFPAIAQTGPGPSPSISLHPKPLNECDTLTAIWPSANPNPSFYSVKIVDNNRNGQTIFQTNVTDPTNSATWVVNATGELHLAIHTPSSVLFDHYTSTDFTVHSGPLTCFSSSATSTPITTTTTPSNMTTTALQSTTPPASTSTATSPVNISERSGSPSSSSSTRYADSSSQSGNIYSSLSTSSTSDTSASPLPADITPSSSHNSPRALNSGAIAGIVIGSLLGIVLAVVALRLLRRRARPRAAAKQSSFTSHIGWLPRTSRSSYTARKSLSSDTYVSEIESVKSLAAWKPEMFVREKPEAGYAQRRASRSPLAQHPSLPSGTPVTVPNRDETQ